MHYRSYRDLSLSISRNLHKIPRGIDLVVGIPRSGMLPATMIGQMLNKPVIALDSYLDGKMYEMGLYRRPANLITRFSELKHVLVMDDSINSGNSMNRVKQKINNSTVHSIKTTYGAVYYVRESLGQLDVGLEECPWPRIFQWNILNSWVLAHACLDIDGVVCVDPTEEQNDDGDNYRAFLQNAKPLYLTEFPISCFVTSRLEKYRDLTEEWLRRNNLRYSELIMLDLPSKQERLKQNKHAVFKAEVYQNRSEDLFIESNLSQAIQIHQLTSKLVFCIENMEMIGTERNATDRRRHKNMHFSVPDIDVPRHAGTIADTSGKPGSVAEVPASPRVRKILFVNHNLAPYELTGTPLTTLNHARRMKAKGLAVAVLIPDSSIRRGFVKIDLEGIPVYKTPKLDQGIAFLLRTPAEWLWHYEKIIDQVLGDFLPDIVHINDYVFLPPDIIRYISRRGIPVVRNVCNTEEICYRIEPVLHSGRVVNLCTGPENMGRCAECYQRSNGLPVSGDEENVKSRFIKRMQFVRDMYDIDVSAAIFTTPEFKDYFTSFVPIREDKIHIVPRGFDFGHSRPCIPVKVDGKLVKFGFVGSGTPRKGIDTLLRAIDTLVYNNNIEIHLYGDIEHEDFICWINELQKKHPNKIFCHGIFTPTDLPRIASEIHCAIIPSYFETYNRVVREMLWLGVPVLATDFFGASIILNGVNGYRIAPGDSCALAKHLTRIIENPDILATLSRGALGTSIPSLEAEANSLLSIYEDLCAQNRHLASPCCERHFSFTSDAEMHCGEGVPADGAAEAHEGILKLLVAAGKRMEAVFALEKLVEANPDYAPAYNDLGVLYGESEEASKALAAYEKAVSLDPANATFRKNLGDFFYVAMKQPDEAAVHYEQVLRSNPQDAETLLILGNLRVEAGHFREARELYLRALELDPSNELAGKMFDALDANGEDPAKRDSDTLIREARCLVRRGQTDRAVHLLETLLSACPDHAAAHNDFGNLLCLLQKPDEALDHLEQAVRLAPGEVGFLRDLADAQLAEAGDIEKALALYNKALALKPDDIETLLRIGNVCGAKGLHNDARFFYDKVLAIEPCHAAARENVKELEKMVSSRPASRKPATIFERCKQLKREGTHNESVMILEDLIAYHFEQRTLQDARSNSHSMSDRIGPAGRPKGTAAVLPFHNAQASSVKATDRSDSPQTNKRLNQAEIQQKKTKIESLPVMVEIASTNVCNILPPCVQCWKHVDPQHGFINKDARHIPERFLTHLAPHIRLTEIITLHGAGEPLTCTYIFDAVQHVHPLTRVGFTSNGLLLTDHNIDKILQSNIHFIDFSIDAASPETYRKIRHNDFNRLLDNIKNLIKKRDETGRKHPEVRINMCLMLENMSEIPAFIRLGKELDAAVVHLFHMNEGADYRFDWFNYKEQHCRLMAREHDEYVRAGFSVAEHLGVNLQFSGRKYFESDDQDPVFYNKTVDISKFWCAKPWDSMLITLDGDIYNCCWQTAPIGTLRSRSFEEIWNEKLIQDIRQSTLCGIPHRICDNRNSPCPFLGRA